MTLKTKYFWKKINIFEKKKKERKWDNFTTIKEKASQKTSKDMQIHIPQKKQT